MTRQGKIAPVRGTQDIFGLDQRRFAHVVDRFQHVSGLYSFKGVVLPVIEPSGVFARSLGETTDVVAKEMYAFADRGGDEVTLRPEFTAGIARAYLSNGWQQHVPLKLATHGPLFRYERPQKGRYRQFHQVNAEILGATEPYADIDLLCMADQLLRELGIGDEVTLQLNTLGDGESRDRWRMALIAHFEAHKADLSPESQDRLARNPLRILDSKEAQDRPIVEAAPGIDDYLTEDASAFFAAVTQGLDAAGVAWTRNARLVRGLDYYRHTAFEFVTDRLGAQGTVLGGGRYDGLIETLGGPPTPAVGWAAGIERLAMLTAEIEATRPVISLVPLGEEAERRAAALAASLRRAGVAVDMAYKGNMKKRMQRANASGARFAGIIGEDELARGELGLKDLESGEQRSVAFDELQACLQNP